MMKIYISLILFKLLITSKNKILLFNNNNINRLINNEIQPGFQKRCFKCTKNKVNLK